MQILVAGAVFTACVTLNLQRRSRGETPKIGLKYGPTFKGQNQPPKNALLEEPNTHRAQGKASAFDLALAAALAFGGMIATGAKSST